MQFNLNQAPPEPETLEHERTSLVTEKSRLMRTKYKIQSEPDKEDKTVINILKSTILWPLSLLTGFIIISPFFNNNICFSYRSSTI